MQMKAKNSAEKKPQIKEEFSAIYGIMAVNGVLPSPPMLDGGNPDENRKFNEEQHLILDGVRAAVRYLEAIGLRFIPDFKDEENDDTERGIDVFNRLYSDGKKTLRNAYARCYGSKNVITFLESNKVRALTREMHDSLSQIMGYAKSATLDKENPLFRYAPFADPDIRPEQVIKSQIDIVKPWLPYANTIPALQQWFEYLNGVLADPKKMKGGAVENNEYVDGTANDVPIGDANGVIKPTLDFRIRLLRAIPGYTGLFENKPEYRECEFLSLVLGNDVEGIRAHINKYIRPKHVGGLAEEKEFYNPVNYGNKNDPTEGGGHFVNQMAARRVILAIGENKELISPRRNTEGKGNKKYSDLSHIYSQIDGDKLSADFKIRKKDKLAKPKGGTIDGSEIAKFVRKKESNSE